MDQGIFAQRLRNHRNKLFAIEGKAVGYLNPEPLWTALAVFAWSRYNKSNPKNGVMSLKIRQAKLASSAVNKGQYPPEELKQIALVGRSNAGKSTLINTLINRKSLARTSSAPGKTRLLNFYEIQGLTDNEIPLTWHFVDLPGYGYAKVSKTERAKWLEIIETFLAHRPQDTFCWQLVDIRHTPSKEDLAMFDILRREGFPLQVIAAKADKISNNVKNKQLQMLGRELGLDWRQIAPFSAITKEGRQTLLEQVENFCLSQE